MLTTGGLKKLGLNEVKLGQLRKLVVDGLKGLRLSRDGSDGGGARLWGTWVSYNSIS